MRERREVQVGRKQEGAAACMGWRCPADKTYHRATECWHGFPQLSLQQRASAPLYAHRAAATAYTIFTDMSSNVHTEFESALVCPNPGEHR